MIRRGFRGAEEGAAVGFDSQHAAHSIYSIASLTIVMMNIPKMRSRMVGQVNVAKAMPKAIDDWRADLGTHRNDEE